MTSSTANLQFPQAVFFVKATGQALSVPRRAPPINPAEFGGYVDSGLYPDHLKEMREELGSVNDTPTQSD